MNNIILLPSPLEGYYGEELGRNKMESQVGMRDVCLSMTAAMTNRYEFVMKDSFGEMNCAAKRASYLVITIYYNIPRRRMGEG